jgi:hypothetical protein
MKSEKNEIKRLYKLIEAFDEEVRDAFRSIGVKINHLKSPRVYVGNFWPSADKDGIYLPFLILDTEDRDTIIKKELYSYYYIKVSNTKLEGLHRDLKSFLEFLLSILAKGYKDETIIKCFEVSIKDLESAYRNCNDYIMKIYLSL